MSKTLTLHDVRQRVAKAKANIQTELEAMIADVGPSQVLVHVLTHPACDSLPLRVEVQVKLSFKL
jgi:hypothetical protein